MHASAGRAGAAALLVDALLVVAATSADVPAAASGVLEAVLAGVLVAAVAPCAVEPAAVEPAAVELAADEQPATPRTSAATITWCTLNLLFIPASPSSPTRDRPR